MWNSLCVDYVMGTKEIQDGKKHARFKDSKLPLNYLPLRFRNIGKTHIQNSQRLCVPISLNAGPKLRLYFYDFLN